MYALHSPANKYFYGYGPTGLYVSQLVSLAMKFKTRAEAEFILQDLKSRSMCLGYEVVEVT